MIEVLITADHSFVMLPCQGGDPDIILRYRATLLTQLFPDACVGAGRCLVDQENTRSADQVVEQVRQSAPVARSDQSEPLLPDDDYREMRNRLEDLSEASGAGEPAP